MGVTAIPVPTSELAKIPAVADPVRSLVSVKSKPDAITGVPVITAAVLLLYVLLDAVSPPMITGAGVIVLVVLA